jgi:hypothetical protein
MLLLVGQVIFWIGKLSPKLYRVVDLNRTLLSHVQI